MGAPSTCDPGLQVWRLNQDLQLRFAEAISGPGQRARLIGVDNESIGQVTLPEAIASGLPYAMPIVSVDGFRTLALDFDLGRGNVEADARAALWLLSSVGINAVLVRSGPEGGFHVLATFSPRLSPRIVEALASALQKRFKSLDPTPLRNRSTGSIRPPGAPHRKRGCSEVVGDLADALRDLEGDNDPSRLSEVADALGVELPKALSPRMETLLREGDVEGRYSHLIGTPDRSRMVLALALGYLNASLSEEEFKKDLLDPRNRGGEKIQEIAERQGPAGAHRYLAQAWAKASKRYVEAPPVRDRAGARDRIAFLRQLADQANWRGTSGATDLAVLKAHYLIAWESGKLAHDASKLDVQLLAGVSERTIPTSHRRLEKAGWLKRIRRQRKPTEAMTWMVVQPAPSFPTPTYTPIGVDLCGATFDHDVWRWRDGLGKAKARLYYLLRSQSRWLEPDLISAYRAGRRTVKKHLSVLKTFGLAERLPDDSWTLGPKSLDEVAELIGVAGKGTQAAKQVAAKRAAYRAYLAERERTAGRIRDPGMGELVLVSTRKGEVISEHAPQPASEGRLSPDHLIAELRAGGMDRFTVARELNRRGIASSKGKFWTAVQVAKADSTYQCGPGDWYMHPDGPSGPDTHPLSALGRPADGHV